MNPLGRFCMNTQGETLTRGQQIQIWKRVGLKALSWKQPFASLMLHGKIETRTWPTKYRGKVLICATKQAYRLDQVLDIAGDKQFNRILSLLTRSEDMPNGVAIAIGDLVDCRPMQPEDEEKCFVRYSPGLFCHVYENVQAIEQFEFKGRQGFSNIPESSHIFGDIKVLD